MSKRVSFSSALVFIVSAVMILQSAFAQSALAANTGEKAVLSALDNLKEAMLKKDRATLEKIFHPDLTYGHSSATVETKAQAIAHIIDGLGWEAIELADTTVRLQGNLAIVTARRTCTSATRTSRRPSPSCWSSRSGSRARRAGS